jgi:hypothetical protein
MGKMTKQIPTEKVRPPQGFFKDIIYKKGKDGIVRKVKDTGWVHNDIVEGMVKLIAALMKNQVGLQGMLFHAQGTGETTWDTAGIPTPGWSDVALTHEYFRKAPDSIVFLDETGNPTPTPTNRLLVQTTLDFADANGDDGLGRNIRCQGMFGGDATSTLDSGFMLDEINHTKRWKDSSVKIVRFIKFIF